MSPTHELTCFSSHCFLHACTIYVIGPNTPSAIVISCGATIGAMFVVVVFITSLFIATIVMLIRSKRRAVRALRAELVLLKAKTVKEQPVIYEEVPQLQDSLKSSSPSIDVGENTAYVSVNTYAKVST